MLFMNCGSAKSIFLCGQRACVQQIATEEHGEESHALIPVLALLLLGKDSFCLRESFIFLPMADRLRRAEKWVQVKTAL